jgi:hypothetical protein
MEFITDYRLLPTGSGLFCRKLNEYRHMTRIEIFTAEEKARTGWWDRLNGNVPRIVTMDYFLHKMVTWGCDAPVILSSRYKSILWTAALIIGWLAVPVILFFSGATLIKALMPALILSPIFITGIVYYLFSKRLNFNLRIDETGIAAKGQHFSWKEIEDTCLMYQRGVAGYTPTLVVLPYNTTAHRFDLAFFSVSSRELAQAIVCFRLKATT